MLRTKNDPTSTHSGCRGSVAGCMGFPARVHHHHAELHRPLCAGCGGSGDAHRRRWHDLVRPGGVRWPGRLRHGMVLYNRRRGGSGGAGSRLSTAALDRAGRGTELKCRSGLVSGFGDASPLRSLLAAGHHCLGVEPVLPVWQSRIFGRPHGHRGSARPVGGWLDFEVSARTRPLDLDRTAVDPVGLAQPAGFPGRTGHSLTQKWSCHGRKHGRGHSTLPHQGVCAGRPAGQSFRLAVCPLAALRQSHPLQSEYRYRIPVHGGRGWRWPFVGRCAGRGAHHPDETVPAGYFAQPAGCQRQF